jgi:hypothetical protein
VESKEEWISAAAALALLKSTLGEYTATLTIAERAHDEIIRSRAARLVVKQPDKKALVDQDCEVPSLFWWARGHAALKQNWAAGDFETWVGETTHLRAYGVTFLRSDIMQIIPADLPVEPSPALETPGAQATSGKGGRPKADWWEDLWIEICRQLYGGELIPKTQADIERAMHQWINDHGHTAGDTTVRDRASKLWRAIRVEN